MFDARASLLREPGSSPSTVAPGQIVGPTHIGVAASAATLSPVANTAYLMWIPNLTMPFTFTRFGVGINTSSGNLDLGIYWSGDEATFIKAMSLGSTASPGTGFRILTTSQSTITPSPGRRWYVAFAADNATINLDTAGGLPGNYKKATSFPLPASLTGVSVQVRGTDGAFAVSAFV